jgi:hypothetical protein
MATKKVTTVTEEEAPQDDVTTLLFTDDDDPADAEVDALEGMISEFSGAADTVVNVYRQGEGKSLSFLFRTNPGEMTGGEIMERTRDNYGTGNYRVHIRKGPRLVANKPFSVEAKKEADPATVQSPGMDITAIMAMMQENNNRTMQMFSETMKAIAGGQSNQPVFDPVQMQASNMQTIAALKALSDPKPDNAKSSIDMFIQGITLAKDLQPKEGETNSSDLLLKGLELFGGPIAEATKAGMLRAQNTDATKPGFAGEHLPPPNPMAPPQPTGDPQVDADAQKEYEMGLQKMMLNQQLSFLLRQAANNKDPELYAELLLDQAGEEKVLAFVGQENAVDQLVALNGEVQNYRGWFEHLRDAILELTAPDAAGENDDTEARAVSGELMPESEPDAISDTANNGDTSGDSKRNAGDTPNP